MFIPVLGERVGVDTAETHPLRDIYKISTNAADAYAAKEKIPKYTEDCTKEGIRYTPFVLETLGGWGTEAEDLFQKICNIAADQQEITRSQYKSIARSKVAVALQKMNARMFIARRRAEEE